MSDIKPDSFSFIVSPDVVCSVNIKTVPSSIPESFTNSLICKVISTNSRRFLVDIAISLDFIILGSSILF